ncbi:10483_t:CDS:2 [Funneliformis caledonium]|uniref:10483_t:CDS:1 n=1 Tax=Funneliformis caledonium TaxID=1117310 RepID=A0A9N9AEN5_9GLOM|nr:10483_t:CDS:2 [Funneliformis caledonium]
MSRLECNSKVEKGGSKGNKRNEKAQTEFLSIKKLATTLFHEHKQLSDDKLKERLTLILHDDNHCIKQLQKLKEKGVTFDQLWNKKIYSTLLNASHNKRGYYIQHVKENNVKKVHENLYMLSDPDNSSSKMYMDTQSVLEAIFNEKHISTKFNAEVVDSWIEVLTDTKQ